MKKDVIISLILVILWMGFIFYLSSIDTNTSNKDSSKIVKGVINTIDDVAGVSSNTKDKHHSTEYIQNVNTIFRKVCHGVCYMALSILVFNLLIRILKTKILIYNIISFIICVIYAGTDEYHQTFISGRTGQISDVLIDTIGILIGLLLISFIYKNYKKRLKNA